MWVRLSWLILLVWVGSAIFGPVFVGDANAIDLEHILSWPDTEAFLGYDDLGRPLGARLIIGARYSMLVALGVVSISLTVGILIGILAGYLGGWFDHLVIRIVDIFLAFPGILLAIALAALLGPGLDNIVFALSIVGWVGFARLARVQTLSLKHREHIQAAVSLGSRTRFIMFRHLLPLLAAPLIIEATFAVAGIVIAEAGLSFLGLGIQPPTPSWGSMIREGTRYMLVSPHMVLVPGVALMCIVLAINLLGDHLSDRLNIRRSLSRR